MQTRAIELFYLFFQGILCFQVLIFFILFLIARKSYQLIYALFLLCAVSYFFINAPTTFFNIPEEDIWKTAWYGYFNTPVIIIMNFFYLVFLKLFYDNNSEKRLGVVFKTALWSTPVLCAAFIVLTIFKVNRQTIFYLVNLISILPAAAVIMYILKYRLPFSGLLASGLGCYIAGTVLTLLMNILRNNGVQHLFTYGYPLFFVRVGILCDTIFLLLAMLRKWHLQEQQLSVEKIQSQLAVEKVRIGLSRELHDDLGATLSGISMYGHLVREQLKASDITAVENSLDVIQQSAVQMVNKLNDAVWMMNPEQDSLQKLVQRLEEYARTMASVKNMQVKVDVPSYLHEHLLPVEKRRNIYMFCKEAINNAVKYSGGTMLELCIKESAGNLEFTVSDNGKGFDAVMVRRGNGLDNMQKRSDEMGAKLSLQSSKEDGTTVSLQINIT